MIQHILKSDITIRVAFIINFKIEIYILNICIVDLMVENFLSTLYCLHFRNCTFQPQPKALRTESLLLHLRNDYILFAS